MRYFALLLNSVWSTVGIIAVLLSIPKTIRRIRNPIAIIAFVYNFWWLTWIPWYRGTRALAIGNVVVLGPLADETDLKHELVHVEQADREPLIYPVLHTIEWLKHGYRNYKYEVEAFARSSNH